MRTRVILAAAAVGIVAFGGATWGSTTIRGHRVGSSHHNGHGSHHVHHAYYGYYPRHYGLSFSYYHVPYYAYPYYPAYPAYVAYGPSYISSTGWIDTDVLPQKAEVYLDGVYVGVADNFDGFPRHLSTEPGVHTITFKAEGYRTANRRIRIPNGTIVRLKFRMVEGVGEDTRFAAERTRDEEENATRPDDETADLQWEGTEGYGLVRLKVEPPDASVYLDGEFYAPASTLNRLHGNLRMESGLHIIEVVKPGHEEVRREIELGPGDRVTVTIDLEKERER